MKSKYNSLYDDELIKLFRKEKKKEMFDELKKRQLDKEVMVKGVEIK